MLAYLWRWCVFFFSRLWNKCTRQYLFQQDCRLVYGMSIFTSGFSGPTADPCGFIVSENSISPPFHTMQSCLVLTPLKSFPICYKTCSLHLTCGRWPYWPQVFTLLDIHTFCHGSGQLLSFLRQSIFSPHPQLWGQHVTCLSLCSDSGWDMSKGIKVIWRIRLALLTPRRRTCLE